VGFGSIRGSVNPNRVCKRSGAGNSDPSSFDHNGIICNDQTERDMVLPSGDITNVLTGQTLDLTWRNMRFHNTGT